MQEHGNISQHCEINIVLLVRSDWSTESRTTIKNCKLTNCEKPKTRSKSAGNKKHSVSTFDQCFHTKDLKFQYFLLTPLTIPMVKDNREKTSRLIGLANVLPMIGSPLEISTKSTQIYCFENWDAWFASGTRNVTLFVLTRSCQQGWKI